MKLFSHLACIAAAAALCACASEPTAAPTVAPAAVVPPAAASATAPEKIAATFAEAWATAQADIKTPEVSDYVGKWSREQFEIVNGEKRIVVMPEFRAMSQCVMRQMPHVRPVQGRMVWFVEASGRVNGFHSDMAGGAYTVQDFCMRSENQGLFLPKPPRAFHYCAQFARQTDKEYDVSFCDVPPPKPSDVPITQPKAQPAAAAASR